MIWVRWTLPRLRIDQVMQVVLEILHPHRGRDVSWALRCGRSTCRADVGLRAMPYAERYLKFYDAEETRNRPSHEEHVAAAADSTHLSVIARSTAEGE